MPITEYNRKACEEFSTSIPGTAHVVISRNGHRAVRFIDKFYAPQTRRIPLFKSVKENRSPRGKLSW